MKIALYEIKKNLQGTNRVGHEAGIPIYDLEHKKRNKHSNRTAKRKEFKKIEDSIMCLWDISKCTNI